MGDNRISMDSSCLCGHKPGSAGLCLEKERGMSKIDPRCEHEHEREHESEPTDS